MSNRVKAVVVTLCMLFVAAVAATPASAGTILVFGQNGTANTIVGTASGGTSTTITATNVSISISAIDAALATPLNAFFNLNATSIGAAVTCFGGNICQEYSGSFSVYSGSGQTGTNYLTGTFTDATFGSGTSLTMSVANPPNSLTFTSSVITNLGIPRGFSLSFTNVSPPVGLSGSTLASFTSNVSGNFSAAAVPEPASLMLIGSGLMGFAAMQRRRANRRAK
jgi:hypothetical protein